MNLWPEILRPYWLLLTPLLGWLLWRLWHRQRRIGRWQRLLPPAFQPLLLTRARLRSSRLPWILLGLAWLLALLALLGPSWQRLAQPDLKQAGPLVVMLEVTPAMLATDARPNRLEQAKRKLLDLLAQRRDAQTAVIVYAGSAHTLVPLSDDLATVRNLLDAVKPSIMPEPGQRPDRAVAAALELLQRSGLGKGQLLLIASSAGQADLDALLRQLQKQRMPLAVLGIGTAEGAPVPDANGNLLKDASGAILMPRLDNAGLSRLARESGGRYLRARTDDSDLGALGLLAGGRAAHQQGDAVQLAAWKDQGYWLLLPLLLLAALAGRRGWLLALVPLLWLPSPSSMALEWQDLWLREDQQGMRLLQAQRPAEAAARFRDAQWRGYAAYQAGDYPLAAALFAESDSAAAHYNRGNALARSDRLQAALEAYDQALARDPQLQRARHNRALVEQLLKEREAAERRRQTQAGDRSEQGQSADHAGDETPAEPADAERERRAAQQGDQPGDTGNERPPQPAAVSPISLEQNQELDLWLRRIPDDPAELLRQKFLIEHRKRLESAP